jgi:hypothetical protein
MLYKRISINLNIPSISLASKALSPILCLVIDSSELTKALETLSNQRNGNTLQDANILEKVSDIARKSPDLFLVLNQQGNELCVWGVDVCFLNIRANFANG